MRVRIQAFALQESPGPGNRWVFHLKPARLKLNLRRTALRDYPSGWRDPVSANNSRGGSVCQPDRAIRSDSLEVRYVADSISTWPASNGKPTDCLGQAIPATQTPESS